MLNLDNFIRQNAAFLTVPNMAEETGLSQKVIRARCQSMNIAPIKLRDQAKQFIMDLCHAKSPAEIAKTGEYKLSYLQEIYEELEISFRRQLCKINWAERGNITQPDLDEELTQTELPQQEFVTPRDVFAQYQVGTHHYYHEDLDF